MKRRVLLFGALTAVLLSGTANAQEKRPIQVADLFRFQRIADPQISPDGKTVAYVVTTVDLAGNSSSSNIWLATTSEGKSWPLTKTS